MARTNLTVPQVYDSDRGDRSLLSKLSEHDAALDALETAGGGISNSINIVARGGDPTGATSVSQLARDLIAELDASGGGTLFFPRGIYKLTKIDTTAAILINQTHEDITLLGEKGTIFKQEGSLSDAYSSILVYGAERVTIRNIQFHLGTVTEFTQATGVDEQIFFINVGPTPTDGVNYVSIENCYFGPTVGDAVRFIGEQTREVKEARVTDCTFDGSDRRFTPYLEGLRACIGGQRNVHRLLISRNVMRGADDAQLDLEPTGEGFLFDLQVVDNIIDNRVHPNGVSQVANAVTIVAPTDSPMGRVVFAGNIVLGGRVQFGSCKDITFSHNIITSGIWTPSDQTLGIIGQCHNVSIVGNRIIDEETAPHVDHFVVSVKSDGSQIPNHVTMVGNNIEWASNDNPAVNVQACDNLVVMGNQFRCTASGAGTHNAINYVPSDATESVVITGNSFVGDAGGGTLVNAIRVATITNIDECVVTGNVGRGVTNGVTIEKNAGGAFLRPPVVSDNCFSATTPVNYIGATGPVLVGGNTGSQAVFSGTGSPESVQAAPVGSQWLRRDGGANTTLYVKESGTGNTGWVAK